MAVTHPGGWCLPQPPGVSWDLSTTTANPAKAGDAKLLILASLLLRDSKTAGLPKDGTATPLADKGGRTDEATPLHVDAGYDL